MLNYLKIKNLALIANAEVEFFPGFNVVTGESGSGKTVLLSTIALLTGRRADKNLLRAGENRCELAAEITVDPARNPEILTALDAAGIEFDRTAPVLQLRRVFTATGNRNFLNDTPVTNATLKAVGDLLVDVHSADEHHTLIHRGRQLELLDRFGNLAALHRDYRQTLDALHALEAERDEKLAHIPSPEEAETLRGIIEEIAAVSPEEHEDEALAEKHKLASNAHEILQLVQSSRAALYDGENSLADQLSAVHRDLEQLQKLAGDGAARFLADAELILESLETLADDLEAYGSNIELDEEAFAALENRLSALFTLKRHYGPSLEQVLSRWHDAEEKLTVFKDFAKLQAEYAKRIEEAKAVMLTAAKKLSEARQKAAEELAKRVSEKLKVLGFAYNLFRLDFAVREPDSTGIDTVDMIFSANPGLAPAPLRLIASSGEIARVMLALKAVLADADAVPVLIFDEIDVNIGGETGVRVGEELANLAKQRQLLCISHLPQVAAKGEHHFAVSKHTENGEVFGTIQPLNRTDRIAEIGRMLGGTEAAIEHAKALLEN